MKDWSRALSQALASGDAGYMKAMLAEVPQEVLHLAAPYIAQLAAQHSAQGRFDEALTCLDQLTTLEPGRSDWAEQRALALLSLQRHAEAIDDLGRILAREPSRVATRRLLADAYERQGDTSAALAEYRKVQEQDRADAAIREKVTELETRLRNQAVIDGLLQSEDAAPAAAPVEPPALPRIAFDPALLADPTLPADMDPMMVQGLTRHLQRYGNLQSSRNVLQRLEDPVWLAAWDQALQATRGGKVLFLGGALGVLPLRALAHGAGECLVVEAQPLDARICAGVVQKNRLAAWHAAHEQTRDTMSVEEKRASFEAFTANVRIVAPDAPEIADFAADWVVCSEIDHALLGAGLVRALHEHAQPAIQHGAGVLPRAARVFVQAVQYAYPGAPYDLQPLDEFRWSPYPEAPELPEEACFALSEPVCAGTLAFAEFAPAAWACALPLQADGRVDALRFWFELDLAGTLLSSAPGAGRALKPAFQHADSHAVKAGEVLALTAQISETRLFFASEPPLQRLRSAHLPSWYVPMLLDGRRNAAYRAALQRLLAQRASTLALDIGAGCGLLSMMAAEAGVPQVIACELRASLCRAGTEIVDRNGYGDSVRFVGKDLRKLTVPNDLPERADLALFEMFDCSLIGEGVLHFLAHAREHLLTPDARYLPVSAVVRAMVVEYRVDRLHDVDVNLLNPYRFSPSFINVDAGQAGVRALSAPVEVFRVDFASATPQPLEADLTLPATEAGMAGGVLFWFDLEVEPGVWLSNAPDSPDRLHWKQGLQFLPEVRVEPDMPLPLQVRHNGSSLGFRWREAEIAQSARSELPRVDPRVWQQMTEIETQTQQLLQHCASNPSEYLKVAELAKRIAVDPAAHDVDATIAQRFVATFFGD